MQAKQFFALFLLVIISVDAMTPEAQANAIVSQFQNNQIVGADSQIIQEGLNNIQKGLVALPEENGLMFDSESAWSIAGDVLSGILAVLSIFLVQEKVSVQSVEAFIQEEAAF